MPKLDRTCWTAISPSLPLLPGLWKYLRDCVVHKRSSLTAKLPRDHKWMMSLPISSIERGRVFLLLFLAWRPFKKEKIFSASSLLVARQLTVFDNHCLTINGDCCVENHSLRLEGVYVSQDPNSKTHHISTLFYCLHFMTNSKSV